jgi:hypothetical protein
MNPYQVLGLRQDDHLTDEDVRAAWRRIASATHPDREDGGDAGRFALAAAAYDELRTEYRRNEARATRAQRAGRAGQAVPGACRVMLVPVVAAVTAGAAAVLAAPDAASGIALVTGIGTWLVLALRRARVINPGQGRWRPAWPGRPTRRTKIPRTRPRAGRPAPGQVPGAQR